MPSHIAPMLATLTQLPRDESNYGFEYKWDGVRAIAYITDNKLRLESRNLLEITPRYPELGGLPAALKGRQVVLDGEIVALAQEGKPSFGLLQRRMHVTDARGLPRSVPIVYMLFDVLYLDGYSLMPVPYERRREILDGLALTGGHWQTPPWSRGEGRALLAAVRQAGLEGVVAKRLQSLYTPGQRSRDWLKIKVVHRQEFVIGGWCPGEGAKRGQIGSLLVGYYPKAGAGRLIYAGGVGTGFTDEDQRRLKPLLERRRRQSSPFATRVPKPTAIFVEPELVAEVEFRQWTEAGILRQPAFKGLRLDKKASEVVREEAS